MEYEKMRVREFLAANWALFESFCEEYGDDPEEIEACVADDSDIFAQDRFGL